MSDEQRNEKEMETRALSSAVLSEGVPDRVLLAPWGTVESQKGAFVVDEESAHAVVSAFRRHGIDLPIDYEHQTLGGEFSSPDGKAPAAGWIKELSVEPGVGIFGHIEWTQQARDMLAARQYRYLSPVALIRQRDRKLVEIHSAALTNKPAIVAMEPIVNRADAPAPQEDPEEFELCQLRASLGLSEDADCREVLSAANQRIGQLHEATRLEHAEQRIAQAMRAGKLTPAQEEWARALLCRDQALFEEWSRSAPIVVIPGVISAPRSEIRDRGGAAARARAEYRSSKTLSQLTSEEAYVADALRQP